MVNVMSMMETTYKICIKMNTNKPGFGPVVLEMNKMFYLF